MSYEEFEKKFKKLEEDLQDALYSMPKNIIQDDNTQNQNENKDQDETNKTGYSFSKGKIIQDDTVTIKDNTQNQNKDQDEANKTGYSFSKNKIIQDDTVTKKDYTQNQNKNKNKNKKQIKTTNLLQDILKNCKNVIRKICNVFSQNNKSSATKEEIYNRFLDLRETYYDIKTSDENALFKLKAYLIYAINSTKILWQLGSTKERYALILGIIANVLSRVAKFIAIATIIFSILFLIANALLFIFFFVDNFHPFPEVSKFLCTWLPSGLQPSHDFLIGYTRIIAWALTAVIMFPFGIGYNRAFDSYGDCQDNENNDVQTKTKNAIGFILAIAILTTLLLGLIWFLCYYMNLEIWTLVKDKTIVITGLLGLGLIISKFNSLNESSDDEGGFIHIIIPKDLFYK